MAEIGASVRRRPLEEAPRSAAKSPARAPHGPRQLTQLSLPPPSAARESWWRVSRSLAQIATRRFSSPRGGSYSAAIDARRLGSNPLVDRSRCARRDRRSRPGGKTECEGHLEAARENAMRSGRSGRRAVGSQRSRDGDQDRGGRAALSLDQCRDVGALVESRGGQLGPAPMLAEPTFHRCDGVGWNELGDDRLAVPLPLGHTSATDLSVTARLGGKAGGVTRPSVDQRTPKGAQRAISPRHRRRSRCRLFVLSGREGAAGGDECASILQAQADEIELPSQMACPGSQAGAARRSFAPSPMTSTATIRSSGIDRFAPSRRHPSIFRARPMRFAWADP